VRGLCRGRFLSDLHPETPAGVPFNVELCHRYTRDQLGVSFVDEPRPTTDEIERLIATTWEEEFDKARKEGRLLYNGDLGRLVRVTTGPDSLHFLLAHTCYRDFFGTHVRSAAFVRSIDPECLADPLGVSSTVITSDGWIVYGRRGVRVALHSGYLHAFGGMLEPPDRLEDGTYDVFAAALRETCEELQIEKTEISEMVITGLVRDRRLDQPELLFDATVTLPRSELERRFERACGKRPQDSEHVAIEFVEDREDAIVGFLRDSAPVAPITQGAALLHGRHRFGKQWYEQALAELYAH